MAFTARTCFATLFTQFNVQGTVCTFKPGEALVNYINRLLFVISPLYSCKKKKIVNTQVFHALIAHSNRAFSRGNKTSERMSLGERVAERKSI